MMGNSMQLLVRSRKVGQKTLESMEKLQYKNLMIKMVDNLHPSNTYLFDRMTRDERQAIFNAGKFFNSQPLGLRLREIVMDTKLRQMI
jgi:hypothetical protein